jgi:hypothetical protein
MCEDGKVKIKKIKNKKIWNIGFIALLETDMARRRGVLQLNEEERSMIYERFIKISKETVRYTVNIWTFALACSAQFRRS